MNSANRINKSYFNAVKLLFRSGVYLRAQSQTVLAAATYFHKFYEHADPNIYDYALIAATCMYLAGKAEEDHFKIRDIINVFHKQLYPMSDALMDLNTEYYALRDSIVDSELLMLRVLAFKVDVDHPHRYMLYALHSLRDWMVKPKGMDVAAFGELCRRLARVAWSLLNDYSVLPPLRPHKPPHVAVGVIEAALLMLRMRNTIPEADVHWWQALCPDMTQSTLDEILEEIATLYERVEKLPEFTPKVVTEPEESETTAGNQKSQNASSGDNNKTTPDGVTQKSAVVSEGVSTEKTTVIARDDESKGESCSKNVSGMPQIIVAASKRLVCARGIDGVDSVTKEKLVAKESSRADDTTGAGISHSQKDNNDDDVDLDSTANNGTKKRQKVSRYFRSYT